MGPIDENSAIGLSSNVYFYNVFIDLAEASYSPGQPLDINPKYFDIVRRSFEQQRNRLENDVEKKMNEIVRNKKNGFGFEPTPAYESLSAQPA